MTQNDPIEITAHAGCATISLRGFVPRPSGSMPTPEEFRERCRAGTDRSIEAFPKLIPALFHWIARLESERQLLARIEYRQSERSHAEQPSAPPYYRKGSFGRLAPSCPCRAAALGGQEL